MCSRFRFAGQQIRQLEVASDLEDLLIGQQMVRNWSDPLECRLSGLSECPTCLPKVAMISATLDHVAVCQSSMQVNF